MSKKTDPDPETLSVAGKKPEESCDPWRKMIHAV